MGKKMNMYLKKSGIFTIDLEVNMIEIKNVENIYAD